MKRYEKHYLHGRKIPYGTKKPYLSNYKKHIYLLQIFVLHGYMRFQHFHLFILKSD